MHFLLFGGTGPSGAAFCKAALGEGHTITIYGRNPTKLPQDVLEHPDTETIVGPLDDKSALDQAAKCGASIFVSFLGPSGGKHSGTPITDCYKYIMPLLIAAKYERAFIAGTAAWTVPQDEPSAMWSGIVEGIRAAAPGYVEEMHAVGEYVTSIPLASLKWTLIRLPHLSNGEVLPVKEGFVSDQNKGLHLTRESASFWILKEIERREWVGKGPILSNFQG